MSLRAASVFPRPRCRGRWLPIQPDARRTVQLRQKLSGDGVAAWLSASAILREIQSFAKRSRSCVAKAVALMIFLRASIARLGRLKSHHRRSLEAPTVIAPRLAGAMPSDLAGSHRCCID
jgi:hypothetical protein